MSISRYTKAGTGSGGDWETARSFDQLETDLGRASGDDEFLIGFDRFHEDPIFWSDNRLSLRRGGNSSQRLKLTFGYAGHANGAVAGSAQAPFPLFRQSGATPFPDPEADTNFRAFLTLRDGASNLDISGPGFHGAGSAGFYRFEGGRAFEDIQISDVHARMAGRVIETTKDTRLSGLTIQHCSAIGLGRGFARFFNLSSSVLRNLDLDAALLDWGGENVCQIIAISEGENVRLENVTMRNAVSAKDATDRGSDYVQGDGLVLEEKTRDFFLQNCHAIEMGDGGFDVKTAGIRFVDCSAINCKYGMRIWSRNEANSVENCTIITPRSRADNQGACLWCGGEVMLSDCLLQAGPGAKIFRFGDGLDDADPLIKVSGGRIECARREDLVAGRAGTLELDNVLINGEMVSGALHWDGERLS